MRVESLVLDPAYLPKISLLSSYHDMGKRYPKIGFVQTVLAVSELRPVLHCESRLCSIYTVKHTVLIEFLQI